MEKVLHSSQQQPCPQMPHRLRGNTEIPQMKIQLPSVRATKGNEGEGKSSKTSIGLQTRLHSKMHSSSVAKTQDFELKPSV